MGLNVADSPDEAAAFVERYGWSWPQIRDPERARARMLGATYQPHFILLDAHGGVVNCLEGRGDEELWSAMLGKLP